MEFVRPYFPITYMRPDGIRNAYSALIGPKLAPNFLVTETRGKSDPHAYFLATRSHDRVTGRLPSALLGFSGEVI